MKTTRQLQLCQKETRVIEMTKELINEAKKSLDDLLKDKAYDDVTKALSEKGIDINDVSDKDVEELVAAEVDDTIADIKGIAKGGLITLFVSLLVGG